MLKLLFFVLLSLATIQVSADTDGIYDGIINLYPTDGQSVGRSVPMTLSLKQTKIEMNPLISDNMFLNEKKIEGSFVLDGEAGPFFFTNSEYDPESGSLTLLYAKVGSTGAPSSIYNLTFECVRMEDGTCSGELSTLKGVIGTFTLKQTSTKVTALSVIPKYVGGWQGTITYTDTALKEINVIRPNITKTMPYRLTLGAGTGTVANPDVYELASTPVKIGTDYVGADSSLATVYSSIFIDYLKGEASLSFTNNGAGGNNASSTLLVDFEPDGSIKGKMNSGVEEGMAVITAEKVQ